MKQAAFSLAVTIVIALAPAARADVTYVDATTANTTPAGFSDTTGTAFYGTSTTQHVWKFRTGFGTSPGNGGIFESGGNTSTRHDDVELTTTFTVPEAGTYNVYVFYLAHTTSGSNDWNIRAGLTSNPGGNQVYDQYGNGTISGAIAGMNAAGLSFTTGADPVVTNQSATYVHYYAVLGQVTVGAGGSVNVYVDDLYPTAVTLRSWYDGVGYELVPEPSSLALLGLSGLCLLRRRR